MSDKKTCAHPAGQALWHTAAILLFAAATVSGAEWREIGSGLPRTIAAVTSLVIDSATPSTLYAVDASRRLFKSIDSGGNWRLRGSVPGVFFVVVDPTNSSTMYAVTERGVLKSTDGGENWAGADSGLAGAGYPSTITIDPLTPATLYATTTEGVFKSTDAARSWNKLDAVPSEAYFNFVGEVTIDPVTPSTIYLEFGYIAVLGDKQGILKSTNGGQSWNMLYNPPGIRPHGLVIDPINTSTLYALSSKSDGNILKSTDGGQTWTVHPAAPPGNWVLSLAIDPANPSTLYAGYFSSPFIREWGLLKSMDSGENWSVLNTGLPPDPGFPFANATPVLAISHTTPATVYSGYFYPDLPGEGHLAKSTDGGITWNAADAGLSYVDVRAVAIDPAIPSKIYAGMGGASPTIPLFTSADGGANWTSSAQFDLSGPAASYGWISCLLVAPASSNLIYSGATTNNGYYALFKTKDGGANWIRSANLGGYSPSLIALDPANSNTIYLGGYNAGSFGGGALYKSVDGGSTWTSPYDWEFSPASVLVIDPGNRGTLYAGAVEGVFQSADGGVSWSNIGLSMGVSSLALDPGDPNTIYAATGGASYFGAGFLGLFKSTDGGASWAPMNNGLASVLDSRSTVTAIAFAPANPSTVYLATSGSGVYKSLDSGASWRPLNRGLTNLYVRQLVVASNALYAVTSGGIFKAID
jgi:photosystem II stability/assembly factor-like uncharacterized protein